MKHIVFCSCGYQSLGIPKREDGHYLYCQTGTYDDEKKTWNITLNKYQRDNLLWLLNACGWGPAEAAVEPFTCANTGDWNGEIPQMLAKPTDPWATKGHLDPPAENDWKSDKDRPNKSWEQLRKDVEFWLDQKKREAP